MGIDEEEEEAEEEEERRVTAAQALISESTSTCLSFRELAKAIRKRSST
jgi:hypothetical protein